MKRYKLNYFDDSLNFTLEDHNGKVKSDFAINICIFGTKLTDKLTLRKKYIGKESDIKYIQAYGAGFTLNQTIIEIESKIFKVQLNIWVTIEGKSSQTRPSFYKIPTGAIFVIDLSDKETFDEVKLWIEKLWKESDKGRIPTIILGNKSALQNIDTKFDLEINDYIINLNKSVTDDLLMVDYFKINTENSFNVNKVFKKIILHSIFFDYMHNKKIRLGN